MLITMAQTVKERDIKDLVVRGRFFLAETGKIPDARCGRCNQLPEETLVP